MTPAERKVLDIFRLYRMGPNKMLCFDLYTYTNKEIRATLDVMVDKKLVVKERPKDAYHLTPAGYAASLRK